MDFTILTSLGDVGDVVVRVWDYFSHRRSAFGRDEFVTEYSNTLSDAIEVVRLLHDPSLSVLDAGTELTLRAIVAVVKSFNRDNSGLEINANYMVPVESSRDVIKHAKFCDHGRSADAFACFLSLTRWAKPVAALPKTFVLPVEHPDGEYADRLLFGAPTAFMNGRRYVVNDTLKLKRHLHKVALADRREEIEKYFRDHRSRFRSFASWPIKPPRGMPIPYRPGSSDVIGVLNVQSDRPAVAGRSEMNHLRLEMALLPLIKVLSYFVVQREYNAKLNRSVGELQAVDGVITE